MATTLHTDPSRPEWRPPASYLQERLFRSTPLAVSNYNVPVTMVLRGSLIPDKLEQALLRLVARHEILRTALAHSRDGVEQIIGRVACPEITYHVVPAADPISTLRRLVSADAGLHFVLTESPLWRASVFSLPDGRHVIVLVMHHSICDGWSSAIIARDLGALYDAAVNGTDPRLPEMPIQFGDYATWERDLRHAALESAWRHTLSRPSGRLSLTLDSRAEDRAYRLIRHQLPPIPTRIVARLRTIATQHRVSLPTALWAVAAMAVRPFFSAEAGLFGLAYANRSRTEVQPLVGPLFNYLPIRLDFTDAPRFLDLLHQVADETASARARLLPLGLIQRAAPDTPDAGPFDVVLNFIPQTPQTPPHASSPLALFPIPTDWVPVRGERHFPGSNRLSFVLREIQGGGIDGHVYGHSSTHSLNHLERIGPAFAACLSTVVTNPSASCPQVPLA